MIQRLSSKLVSHNGDTLYNKIKEIDSKFTVDVKEIPRNYTQVYKEPIQEGDNPQGLGESGNYYFIVYDKPNAVHVKRVHKLTGETEDSAPFPMNAHPQGLLVESDDVVMFTHANTGLLAKYNFKTGVTSASNVEGLVADYPCCWDGVDTIYQLDTVNSGQSQDGRFDVIRMYSIKSGSKSGTISLPREMVREGFVQGIAFYDGELFAYTGGSYSGTDTSNKNVTSIYHFTQGGLVKSSLQFYAAGFAQVFPNVDAPSNIQYEAQGIVVYNGIISLLCYTGSGQANILRGSIEEVANSKRISTGVGATAYTRLVRYDRFQDLNIGNDELAASGDALAKLAGRMLDNSELECNLDYTNYSAITSQIGEQYGVLRLYRANAYRIFGEVHLNANNSGSSKKINFSIVNNVTQPMCYTMQYRKKSDIIYSDAKVAVSGDIINMDYTKYNKFTVLLTHGAGTNPASLHTFDVGDIQWLIDNDQGVYLTDGTGSISAKFTAQGLSVTGATNNPIIRRVLAG